MGHPPHPRVTPSGKGGSRRPHHGGKPSSERRSAAGARLINLGPFQSRPRRRPPRPFAPPLAAHSLPHSFPGWLRALEPRKLLFSATGHGREHPSRPAIHAAARPYMPTPGGRREAIPTVPPLPRRRGRPPTASVMKTGLRGGYGYQPGCAWSAKLSLGPRDARPADARGAPGALRASVLAWASKEPGDEAGEPRRPAEVCLPS